jgi:putative transposase
MSELRKANTAHPYFITMTIVGWIDLFTRERYCEAVTDSLDTASKSPLIPEIDQLADATEF